MAMGIRVAGDEEGERDEATTMMVAMTATTATTMMTTAMTIRHSPLRPSLTGQPVLLQTLHPLPL
jgi:hypothetical protein